jgi:hypothetical protein
MGKSLFESIGTFAKGLIPGSIDDVIIDTITKGDTIGKIKEGFFPSKGDDDGASAQPFIQMKGRDLPEIGARRDISRIERLTGETQSRWTRFMTASIMQKFAEGNTVTPVPSSAVKKVRPTRAAKARMTT